MSVHRSAVARSFALLGSAVRTCTLIVGLALPAFGASTAGITSPGTNACPNAGMTRLSKIIFSTNIYSSLYGATIDAGNGFGYFSTAGSIDPGNIIKVDLRGAAPVELGTAHCVPGVNEFNLLSAVTDPATGFAYFGTTSNPGRVIKVALGSGTNAPTYVSSITLSNGENSDGVAVIDDSDPNPANHYAYFGCAGNPGRVVKIALGTFQEIGSVVLLTNETVSRRAVIDTLNGYAYFAGPAGGAFALPKVIKVALGAGTNPPVRIGAVTLDSVFNGIGAAAIDVTNGYAYFGIYRTNVPAKVYKVALGASNDPPTLVQTLTMSAGTREFASSVSDPVAGCALFGTDHVHPAKVHKIKFGAGSSPPVDAGFLYLMAGTCATNVPSCYPADGGNLINTNPALYGELYLQSAIIDTSRGYAWFGCDSHPGQVVKVAYAHKGLIKATRVVLSETAYVSDMRFYSHLAAGNLRLAIYDNASPKNLRWQSASVANTASNAWVTNYIFSGSPTSLTLTSGTYWLAWQVDTTLDVPSYTAGAMGDEFILDQNFSDFPATISGEQSSSNKWSAYITYNASPPAPPVFTNLGYQPDGNFQLGLAALPDYPFGILASTNLTNWERIGNGVAGANGLWLFKDTNTASFQRRFYRAVWP